jgi:hypothetical protein
LVTQLLPIEEAEYDEWLEKLTEHIQKQSLVSPVLEKQHIELAIRVMFSVIYFNYSLCSLIINFVLVLKFLSFM